MQSIYRGTLVICNIHSIRASVIILLALNRMFVANHHLDKTPKTQ